MIIYKSICSFIMKRIGLSHILNPRGDRGVHSIDNPQYYSTNYSLSLSLPYAQNCKTLLYTYYKI